MSGFPISDAILLPVPPFIEGNLFPNIPLAQFYCTNLSATVSNFTSNITSWGDLSPADQLTITQIDGTASNLLFLITAKHHTYDHWILAPYPITITITSSSLDTITLISSENEGITVLDAELLPMSTITFRTIEGLSFEPLVLCYFIDQNPYGRNSDYDSITVDWGDKTTPDTLTSSNLDTTTDLSEATVFEIIRTIHQYSEAGTYGVICRIHSEGGSYVVLTATVEVTDAPLTPFFPQPTLTGNSYTNEPIYAIVDANLTSTPNDFSSDIDWGDGTPISFGTITQPAGIGTKYIINGTHIYLTSGVYTIIGHIADVDGSTITVTNTATVLTNYVSGPFEISIFPFKICHKKIFTGYIASVIDWSQNNNLPPTLFTALIDWGDKHSDIGTIILTGTNNSQYLISGTHKYCEKGDYNISVTFTQTLGNMAYARTICQVE